MINKDNLTKELLKSYDKLGLSRSVDFARFPSISKVRSFLESTKDILFPGIYRSIEKEKNLNDFIQDKVNEVDLALNDLIQKNLLYKDTLLKEKEVSKHSTKIVSDFFNDITQIREFLIDDAHAIFNGDPAAKTVEEILMSYVTFQSILVYRIAHFFYKNELFLFARMMAEISHFDTSIDIHPGAKIGRSFCIDHGTGIVIGETAEIGENVKLYQGVTLGAFSVDKADQDKKRHPTIEDNVTVYAMSTILGGSTVVGSGSIIGANVWLTKSVPENSKIKLSTIA